MNYVLTKNSEMSLKNAQAEKIALNPWNTPYEPETLFEGAYIENRGFLFRLTCFETDPRITYLEPGGEVCEDSCMEIFLNFSPETSADYINFEMNAGGAYLFGVGPDRYERVDLKTEVMPTVSSEILEDRWTATLFIPLETVKEHYGDVSFESGYRFTGNAYKCGDLTKIPHYLTWNPVVAKEPDFHRPECFGTFEIGK